MSKNAEFAQTFPIDFEGFSFYIPTRESIENYYYHGWHPGGFVYHLLANDLVGAACRADSWNTGMLAAYARWLNDKMPSCAWGSAEIVDEWMRGYNES